MESSKFASGTVSSAASFDNQYISSIFLTQYSLYDMFDMFKSILSGGAGGSTSISSSELKQRLNTGDKPVLLDVRQPQEHKSRNIPGSILIPLGELPSRIKELEKHKSREIVVYCASGGRSSSACSMLSQAGYSVKNLSGGMMGW